MFRGGGRTFEMRRILARKAAFQLPLLGRGRWISRSIHLHLDEAGRNLGKFEALGACLTCELWRRSILILWLHEFL